MKMFSENCVSEIDLQKQLNYEHYYWIELVLALEVLYTTSTNYFGDEFFGVQKPVFTV